ncbi:hypothetical protein VTO42DRAFT_7108 [Malbranchea cinnamomea]
MLLFFCGSPLIAKAFFDDDKKKKKKKKKKKRKQSTCTHNHRASRCSFSSHSRLLRHSHDRVGTGKYKLGSSIPSHEERREEKKTKKTANHRTRSSAALITLLAAHTDRVTRSTTTGAHLDKLAPFYGGKEIYFLGNDFPKSRPTTYYITTKYVT